MRAAAYVDLKILEQNYALIRSKLPKNVRILCVVKADAYGHGAVEVSRRLESLGANYLGVATVAEGMELRPAGIRSPILVMGGIFPWDSESPFCEGSLTPVIYDTGMLERLGRNGLSEKPIKVHIKVDTGMGRLGFRPEEIPWIIEKITSMHGIEIEGLMSHFPSSEVRDEFGQNQIRAFHEVLQMMKANGLVPEMAHMANSGAITTYPEGYFDMVRVGISLYGSHSSIELGRNLPVRQVMRFVSRIVAIREFPLGSTISYGRTFVTKRRSQIASIPVGYADGYPRELSNKGFVLIRGRRCNVVGRICMDWIFVDITGIPGIAVGDEVTLIGQGDGAVITADEIAGYAGTIPYEILCRVSKRVVRIYV